MRISMNLATLGMAALLLAACGKKPGDAPAPQTTPVTTETGTAPSAGAGMSAPSVNPAASSAVEPTRPAAEAGRANATMTRSQESSAMPMAGQNNDHSAPVAPAKPASASR